MMNSSQSSVLSIICLTSWILYIWAIPANAEPLEKWDCKSLTDEQLRMEKTGVKDKILRGAQWAQDNLDPSALDQIKQYLVISEQLKFRCPTKKVKTKKKKKVKKRRKRRKK